LRPQINVLHLHVVDWQSWPLQSVSYPGLWNASWSKRERYTFNDMRTLVAYANARGIVVLPEFDTPGHATSMCTAYPELCCSAKGCGAGNNNPLSPVPDASGRNVTLDAIKAVLTEMASVFPGEFFHLGCVSLLWGQTVPCWRAGQRRWSLCCLAVVGKH
jgi:hexosaminidase